MSDKVTIKIPRNLYNKLGKIIDDTGFNSVTEFIVYVLRDLVTSTEMEKEAPRNQDSLTSEEVKLIRERLKNLGYLS